MWVAIPFIVKKAKQFYEAQSRGWPKKKYTCEILNIGMDIADTHYAGPGCHSICILTPGKQIRTITVIILDVPIFRILNWFKIFKDALIVFYASASPTSPPWNGRRHIVFSCLPIRSSVQSICLRDRIDFGL